VLVNPTLFFEGTLMPEQNRVWRLSRRPKAEITPDVLSLKTEPISVPADGEVLVRVNYVSLDPTNRVWMSDIPQYMPPVALGEVMRGIVCGTVVESRAPGYSKGDVVGGLGGWADYLVLPAQGLNKLAPEGNLPLLDTWAILSVVGPTAYFGLIDIGQPKPGETLVVSTAAGAVGSFAAQIGKLRGCHVVGLAGSADKCAWLKNDLRLDGAINYKTEDVAQALRRECPKGIDIYFDNVGGDVLDACLALMNLKGRIVTCGLISGYNAEGSWGGPKNYAAVLMQRLRIEGFIVLDYLRRYPEAINSLVPWMIEGKLKYRLDVVDGLENAATAVKRLYTGENKGKLVIAVAPPT
jgi:NADPH-dependent curcumin reductase